MRRLLRSVTARWVVALCLTAAVAVTATALVFARNDEGPEAAAVEEATSAPGPTTAATASPTAAQEETAEPGAAPEPEPVDPPVDAPEEDAPQGPETEPVDPSVEAPAEDAKLAEVEQPVAPPAPIDQPSVQDGVAVSLAGLEAVAGEAEGIGQIGGPAIRFSITVRNNTASAVDLTESLVTVEAGPEREPGTELIGPGVLAFPESVAPGGTATATFVFLVAPEQRSKVLIQFNYSASAPILAFEGPAPAA